MKLSTSLTLVAVFTVILCSTATFSAETFVDKCTEIFIKNPTPETRFLHPHEIREYCEKLLSKSYIELVLDNIQYQQEQEKKKKERKSLEELVEEQENLVNVDDEYIDPNTQEKGVKFCSSCHNMQEQTKNYLLSSHASKNEKEQKKNMATCADCHISPGAVGYARAKIKGVEQMFMTYHGKHAPEEDKVKWKGIFDFKYYWGLIKVGSQLGINTVLEMAKKDLIGDLVGTGVIPKERRVELAHHVREEMIRKDSDSCKKCHSFSKMPLETLSANAAKKHAYAMAIRAEIKEMEEDRNKVAGSMYQYDHLNDTEEDKKYLKESYEEIKKLKAQSTCVACHSNFHQGDMRAYSDEFDAQYE